MTTVAVREELLTVSEILAELRVSRSTWFLWRQIGKAPKAIKLPNGELRVRRSDLEEWLVGLESDAT